MNKLAGWDETEAYTGEYEKIEAGGYVCLIVNADAVKSKTGKEMLKLAIDIAEGEHKDFYKRRYEQDKQLGRDAKWRGYYYQLTEGDSMSRFKGLITAIEKSNNGYTWDWNEKGLKGKKFGGIFGEEEYINNSGKVATATKLMLIREVDGIEDAMPPEPKKLDNSPMQNSFGNSMPDNEEIPF